MTAIEFAKQHGIDIYADGYMDAVMEQLDSDEQAKLEDIIASGVIPEDVNKDGDVDVVTEDTNGNGTIDAVTTISDSKAEDKAATKSVKSQARNKASGISDKIRAIMKEEGKSMEDYAKQGLKDREAIQEAINSGVLELRGNNNIIGDTTPEAYAALQFSKSRLGDANWKPDDKESDKVYNLGKGLKSNKIETILQALARRVTAGPDSNRPAGGKGDIPDSIPINSNVIKGLSDYS